MVNLTSKEEVNQIRTTYLHQNLKNFTNLSSIILLTNEIRFEDAMNFMLMNEYFY